MYQHVPTEVLAVPLFYVLVSPPYQKLDCSAHLPIMIKTLEKEEESNQDVLALPT